MTQPPAPRISVAHLADDGRLHAPAAERNAHFIVTLLERYAPPHGDALEIASGTGQHVVAFAKALPGLTWQPTDVEEARLQSIRIWSAEAGLDTILPPLIMDATSPGWGKSHAGKCLVVLVNLLHLIPAPDAARLLQETYAALMPGGRMVFYGPFLRNGVATSEGDQQFHASLEAQETGIGYKDDRQVLTWLKDVGLQLVTVEDMPSNNLAFVAERPLESL